MSQSSNLKTASTICGGIREKLEEGWTWDRIVSFTAGMLDSQGQTLDIYKEAVDETHGILMPDMAEHDRVYYDTCEGQREPHHAPQLAYLLRCRERKATGIGRISQDTESHDENS